MAKALEGTYDGAVHITTDYEVSGYYLKKNVQSIFLVTRADLRLSFHLDSDHPGEGAHSSRHFRQLS